MPFTAAELAVLHRYDRALDGILHEPDSKAQRKLERTKRANRKYHARMREALNRIRREKKAKANTQANGTCVTPPNPPKNIYVRESDPSNAQADGAGASPAPVQRLVGLRQDQP